MTPEQQQQREKLRREVARDLIREWDRDDMDLNDPNAWDRAAEAAIAICARRFTEVAEAPGFVEARDTEWDNGFNFAKRYIARAIRAFAGEE